MLARRRRSLPALASLVLVLAACARSGGGGSSASPSTASASASSASGQVQEVTVAHTGAGDALAGKDGRTLYVFTRDSAGTPTCTDSCATNWPPFTLDAGEATSAGSGVSADKLGTVAGANGATQVTYNGRPLYYFKGDSAAGEANGQGLNGVWFIAAPDGSVPAASAGTSASPAASTGGYNYSR